VRLVAAVNGDQVGGQGLDLAAVAQPARVDAAGAGDPGRQAWTVSVASRSSPSTSTSMSMVSTPDQGAGPQTRGGTRPPPGCPAAAPRPARRAALGDRQRISAALVEAERVHAIHHDLARQLRRQPGQQLAVAFPRHRGDHQVRFPRAVTVGQAAGVVSDLLGDPVSPVVAAGTDDDRVPRHANRRARPRPCSRCHRGCRRSGRRRWGFAFRHDTESCQTTRRHSPVVPARSLRSQLSVRIWLRVRIFGGTIERWTRTR